MEDGWNIHVGFEVYHFHYGSRGRNLERIVSGFSEKTLVVCGQSVFGDDFCLWNCKRIIFGRFL